jgi:diguanylate cyclase (GGDEF)-like protein
MNRLVARDCLSPHVIRVHDNERPSVTAEQTVFAVFSGSIDDGVFCGLATAHDVAVHQSRNLVDLAAQRPIHFISPTADVKELLETLEAYRIDALAVVDDAGKFQGAVTHASLSAALLLREEELREEIRQLKSTLASEQESMAAWSSQLTQLCKASHGLLGILTYSSSESDLLKEGIIALAKLIRARYGAIGLLGDDGSLSTFVHYGMTEDEVNGIGRLPEGKGLLGIVIKENIALRVDDLSKDPRSAGCPPGHHPMKTLLAVPVSHRGRVYGRIYLCEKEGGEHFSADDEALTMSFALSLSLALDNARAMEDIKRAHDHLARFDSLTGLPNRQLLLDRIERMLVRAQHHGQMAATLFVDLDDFKKVNDTLGHSLGDMLLKAVSRRISGCLREEHSISRLGGDEFVVLLPEIKDRQEATTVAQKLLDVWHQPFQLLQHEVFVSASIGVCLFPADARDVEGTLANANIAMYHAKSSGKNNCQFYAPAMNVSAEFHLKLETHLRHALERNELSLCYQPQVETVSGKIVGMEALLRWHSSALGILSPGDFIPLAESTGLIVPIGEWVLRTACAQAKQWEQTYPVRIAVNLSARQFQHDGLLDTVAAALEETGLAPHMLELEITESILMQQFDTIIHTLGGLKARGVRFAIDDFGTGYSSLSYLKRFPIDVLKIDKSFVRDIAEDPSDAAIVSAITAIARELGLDVVAEGLETKEQLAHLIAIGCQYLQGYYFSKPLVAAEATVLLQQYGTGLVP